MLHDGQLSNLETVFPSNTPPVICSISQGNSPTEYCQQRRNGWYPKAGAEPGSKKGPGTRLEFRRGGCSSPLVSFEFEKKRRVVGCSNGMMMAWNDGGSILLPMYFCFLMGTTELTLPLGRVCTFVSMRKWDLELCLYITYLLLIHRRQGWDEFKIVL